MRRETRHRQANLAAMTRQPPEKPLRAHWSLEPGRVFLNHGSYGACPQPVLAYQSELRARLERSPSDFMGRQYRELLAQAGEKLAQFLSCEASQLAWVTNATTGVNAVLRSLRWMPGDQILLTDHGYNACRNVAEYLAQTAGVEIVEVALPFPPKGSIADAVLAAVTSRTRLAMLDHVSSPSGLVFPLAELAGRLAERKVKVLVDGAHAPGMLALDLPKLGRQGVTYYTGNLHKWCCSPKGAAFLWVAQEDQGELHPPVISHGFNALTGGGSRFFEEFHWCGTFDPTAWLAVPRALRFIDELFSGGWDECRARCHGLLLEGRNIVAESLPATAAVATNWLGQMATFEIPACDPVELYRELYDEFGIDIWTAHWKGRTLLRLSAAPYNTISDYHALAAALRGVCARRGWS